MLHQTCHRSTSHFAILLQGAGVCLSKLRFRIAEAVLVIPHSNAEEERLFSIVRKNKTDSRSCLGLDGSLCNILAMKLAYPEEITPCYKFRPSDDQLKSSKKAAPSYNREHK